MIRLESSRSHEEMSKNPLAAILEANIFNRTNYNDWLQNLRIVLDFENQTYVLDRSLPRALPEGSIHEERLTFKKWHEDNRKVHNIVLASMTNDIQKQLVKSVHGLKSKSKVKMEVEVEK
ncbi:UNVERIFIED_CONTAM: hypothetical protein Scaly_2807200 [Sesamum calycinum]|uniref:Retrotransposon Copia-like N-terminal domain-containing protein n=1 Tax=Sesamum calycinum TaxID=2727403 RepID=A0AAW2IUV1_9LAMI